MSNLTKLLFQSASGNSSGLTLENFGYQVNVDSTNTTTMNFGFSSMKMKGNNVYLSINQKDNGVKGCFFLSFNHSEGTINSSFSKKIPYTAWEANYSEVGYWGNDHVYMPVFSRGNGDNSFTEMAGGVLDEDGTLQPLYLGYTSAGHMCASYSEGCYVIAQEQGAPNGFKYSVFKINSSGVTQWKKVCGFVSSNSPQSAFISGDGVFVDENDDLYIAGTARDYSATGSQYIGVILKLSSNGTSQIIDNTPYADSTAVYKPRGAFKYGSNFYALYNQSQGKKTVIRNFGSSLSNAGTSYDLTNTSIDAIWRTNIASNGYVWLQARSTVSNSIECWCIDLNSLTTGTSNIVVGYRVTLSESIKNYCGLAADDSGNAVLSFCPDQFKNPDQIYVISLLIDGSSAGTLTGGSQNITVTDVTTTGNPTLNAFSSSNVTASNLSSLTISDHSYSVATTDRWQSYSPSLTNIT